jgi:hypothetical protein
MDPRLRDGLNETAIAEPAPKLQVKLCFSRRR